MGRYLNPRCGQLILFSGYPVLTAANCLKHKCAISGCTLAPKLANKNEIKHWFPDGADGRSVYGQVITKFSRMNRFLKLWDSAITCTSRNWSSRLLINFTAVDRSLTGLYSKR